MTKATMKQAKHTTHQTQTYVVAPYHIGGWDKGNKKSESGDRSIPASSIPLKPLIRQANENGGRRE